MTNQPPKAPPIIDNPHAPEVFSDGATGISYFNGVIRLTFESARTDFSTPPGPVNRVIIGRLVLPLGAAEGLRDLLADYLAKVKAQAGGDSSPAPQALH